MIIITIIVYLQLQLKVFLVQDNTVKPKNIAHLKNQRMKGAVVFITIFAVMGLSYQSVPEDIQNLADEFE